MSIPIQDILESGDVPADPGAASTGTTRIYTKAGRLYTEAPDTTVVGPAQFGFLADIAPVGGTAAAGTSGRVADAAHVHVGGALTIKDEGTPLATDATSLNFVGAGVVASGTGAAKTITISGSSVADIVDLPTAETVTTKVLAPDGAGGVEFRAEAGGGVVGYAPLHTGSAAGTTNSLAVTVPAGLSTSLFLAFMSTTSGSTISSISQTNVTWTKLHSAANGTSAGVEIWKGVPTGAPGTTVTFSMSSSQLIEALVAEWPVAAGLAGTVDQVVDVTTTGTQYLLSGTIVPSQVQALVVHVVSHGPTIAYYQWLGGPIISLAWSALCLPSYGWPGKTPVALQLNLGNTSDAVSTIMSII